MPLQPSEIRQHTPAIWILVADGGRAQIYRYHHNKAVMPMHEPQWHATNSNKEHHELTPVEGLAFTAESLKDFQVSHDGSGSLIGGNSAHNSVEPHLDVHDEVKQNLVMAVVAKLKQACDNHDFDQLVIAASPKILGYLRRHLPVEVIARVIAEIPKDFTKAPTDVLLAHLQETLTAAHVA